jgi:hypothetical protein
LELALGHDLAETLDHLADVAPEDAEGAVTDEALGLGACLGMDGVSGLPELEDVQEVEHEGDIMEEAMGRRRRGPLALGG